MWVSVMIKKHLSLFLVGNFFPLVALADSLQNCSLPHPPLEAAATENDGAYLFFHPRKLSSNYTGCQVMWDEKGRPLITLVFRAGKLSRYEYANIDNPVESGVCTYRMGALVKGDSDICPAYEDAKNGFRAVGSEASFKVPAARDPRTRGASGAKSP